MSSRVCRSVRLADCRQSLRRHRFRLVVAGFFGAPAATTSATVETEVVSNASSASPAGGFAGVYKDPQACVNWEIEDACAVMAVRESDGREVRGGFQGSLLTLQFQKDKKFKASLRGRQLEWETGAPSWIKE